jgi:hypothetical protein
MRIGRIDVWSSIRPHVSADHPAACADHPGAKSTHGRYRSAHIRAAVTVGWRRPTPPGPTLVVA